MRTHCGKDKEDKQFLKVAFCAASVCMALSLGGCGGDFPNLSEKQLDQAGEYAAILLLKYDSENRSRLMGEEEMEKEASRREAWKAAARQQKIIDQQEEEKKGQESQEQTDPIEIIEATELPGRISDGFSFPDGVTIEYLDYQVCDIYPTNGTGYFSITASPGKDNLVLTFRLTNGSDGSHSLDLTETGNSYRLTVNGDYTRMALPTILEQDLMNYQGMLMPGESTELVLLYEIDEGTPVSAMKMRLKNDRIESTIYLK